MDTDVDALVVGGAAAGNDADAIAGGSLAATGLQRAVAAQAG